MVQLPFFLPENLNLCQSNSHCTGQSYMIYPHFCWFSLHVKVGDAPISIPFLLLKSVNLVIGPNQWYPFQIPIEMGLQLWWLKPSYSCSGCRQFDLLLVFFYVFFSWWMYQYDILSTSEPSQNWFFRRTFTAKPPLLRFSLASPRVKLLGSPGGVHTRAESSRQTRIRARRYTSVDAGTSLLKLDPTGEIREFRKFPNIHTRWAPPVMFVGL